MNIVVYTIGCPSCKVLEMKLQRAGIAYSVVTDRVEMEKLNIKTAPMMQVDGGPLMNFHDSI